MSYQTVIHKVLSAASRFPERTAIVVNGTRYTYRQLIAHAASAKKIIEENGYASEKFIGVLTGDDIHTYAAILGILANGSAYVPINKHNPRSRNIALIEAAGLNVILTSNHHDPLDQAAKEAAHPAETLLVQVTDRMDSDRKLEIPRLSPKDPVYLIFTSGSTGTPKGVPIAHENLDSFLEVMLDKRHFDFSRDDRFLQMFELSFDPSVMSLFIPLCIGASCFIVPEHGIAYLNAIEILGHEEITVAVMVPSVLAYMAPYFDEIDLPALRYSIFCGEALPQALVEPWSNCVPNAIIQNMYGPTEATIVCTAYGWSKERSASEAYNGIVPIGKPMPGTHAFVVDEKQDPVSRGEKGELCLTGSQITKGYWKDSQKTEQAFVRLETPQGPLSAYRTGDLCFLNETGNYVFCGRIDFQVKIDGYRVELGEIEHFAREFSGQPLLAVLPTTDPDNRLTLHLVIERTPVSVAELEEYLRSKLPPHMCPKQIHMLDEIPLNINGKIDRSKLLERISK